MLLFEPSSVCSTNHLLALVYAHISQIYGGKTLFEQFDADVQDQIHIFLEEAVVVLDQAH